MALHPSAPGTTLSRITPGRIKASVFEVDPRVLSRNAPETLASRSILHRAYEHLCILILLPSLDPLHLMLADTPWPRDFGATLTNVGPLSEGFEPSVASPLQPRRLCAMGRTV
jgi:hypothetical protein